MFFAARPDPEALEALVDCQRRLMEAPWQRQVRWTARQHIHMTLRFLGDTPRPSIPEIVSFVGDKLTVPELTCQILGTTLFPNSKRPSVIVATVAGNELLSQLARQLNRLTEHFGYKPEKRQFRPHMTLGRCKQQFPRGVDVSEVLDAPISSRIDTIILFESATGPDGAHYTEIARWAQQ